MKYQELVKRLVETTRANVVRDKTRIPRRGPFITYLAMSESWKLGVELGVWKGGVLKSLLSRIPHIEVVGVDLYAAQPNNTGPEKWVPGEHGHPWDHERYYREVLSWIETHAPGRGRIIRDWTINAVKEFEDESLDFIFVDADHSSEAVRRDLEDWIPKIKPSGWIVGHDLDWKSVRDVIDEMVPGYVAAVDNVWCRPKEPTLWS